jgi:hypothetical protein
MSKKSELRLPNDDMQDAIAELQVFADLGKNTEIFSKDGWFCIVSKDGNPFYLLFGREAINQTSLFTLKNPVKELKVWCLRTKTLTSKLGGGLISDSKEINVRRVSYGWNADVSYSFVCDKQYRYCDGLVKKLDEYKTPERKGIQTPFFDKIIHDKLFAYIESEVSNLLKKYEYPEINGHLKDIFCQQKGKDVLNSLKADYLIDVNDVSIRVNEDPSVSQAISYADLLAETTRVAKESKGQK